MLKVQLNLVRLILIKLRPGEAGGVAGLRRCSCVLSGLLVTTASSCG